MIKIKTDKSAMAKFLYSVSSVVVVFSICWLTLYKSNFLYGFWHDYGGIGETINYYSPKNYHIKGFENTTKEQRAMLFAQINQAVHFNPDKLGEITFSTIKNNTQPLLHRREIIHLNDVANLIQVLYKIVVSFALLWLVSLLYLFKKRALLSRLKIQVLNVIIAIILTSLIIASVGATKTFYALHELIFPNGNQWYFYYEDSLMSTLMSAPDLFGWIALAWLILFIVIYPIFQYLISTSYRYLLNRKR